MTYNWGERKEGDSLGGEPGQVDVGPVRERERVSAGERERDSESD